MVSTAAWLSTLINRPATRARASPSRGPAGFTDIDASFRGYRQVHPVLGRVLVGLQEDIGVVNDLGDRFRVLGAVVELECLDRDPGIGRCPQRYGPPASPDRDWVRRLRQRSKNIGLFAPLLVGRREHLADRFPESQSAIPRRPAPGRSPQGGSNPATDRPHSADSRYPSVNGEQLFTDIGTHADYHQTQA
jgi:hypothetical protein